MKLERSEDKDRDPRALPQHRVLRPRAPTASRPPPAPTSTCTPPTSTPARRRCSSGCSARRSRPTPWRTWRRPRRGAPASSATWSTTTSSARTRPTRSSPRRSRPPTRPRPPPPTAGLAPHFVEWVRQQVVAELGRGRALRPGPPRRHHPRPRRPAGRRGGGRRGDHRPGRARRPRSSPSTRTAPSGPTSGSRDYETLKVDLARGADGGGSGRQPGSTFKPFVLQAALAGRRHPGRPLRRRRRRSRSTSAAPSSPSRTTAAAGFGELTVADATKQLGQHRVRAARRARSGPSAVADAAHAAGIDAELDEVPVDRARRGGGQPAGPGQRRTSPTPTTAPGSSPTPSPGSRTATATCIWEPDRTEPEEDAVDPDVARAVTEALRGVIESGTGTAADIGRPAAGKTGTTQDNVDAWFAGYVPGYAAVVWVGHPEPTPMDGVTGGGLPAQIWQRYMSVAMEGREVEDFPDAARGPPASRARQHHQLVVEHQLLVHVVDRHDPGRRRHRQPGHHDHGHRPEHAPRPPSRRPRRRPTGHRRDGALRRRVAGVSPAARVSGPGSPPAATTASRPR